MTASRIDTLREAVLTALRECGRGDVAVGELRRLRPGYRITLVSVGDPERLAMTSLAEDFTEELYLESPASTRAVLRDQVRKALDELDGAR